MKFFCRTTWSLCPPHSIYIIWPKLSPSGQGQSALKISLAVSKNFLIRSTKKWTTAVHIVLITKTKARSKFWKQHFCTRLLHFLTDPTSSNNWCLIITIEWWHYLSSFSFLLISSVSLLKFFQNSNLRWNILEIF